MQTTQNNEILSKFFDSDAARQLGNELAQEKLAKRVVLLAEIDRLSKTKRQALRNANTVLDGVKGTVKECEHDLRKAEQVVRDAQSKIHQINSNYGVSRLQRELSATAPACIDDAIVELHDEASALLKVGVRIVKEPKTVLDKISNKVEALFHVSTGTRALDVFSNKTSLEEKLSSIRMAVEKLEALKLTSCENVERTIEEIKKTIPQNIDFELIRRRVG